LLDVLSSTRAASACEPFTDRYKLSGGTTGRVEMGLLAL
jgi:hypothetical protein